MTRSPKPGTKVPTTVNVGAHPTMTTLLQFDSGYFCAVVEARGGLITYAAPILKYMRGWPESRALTYGERKGWKLTYRGPR